MNGFKERKRRRKRQAPIQKEGKRIVTLVLEREGKL